LDENEEGQMSKDKKPQLVPGYLAALNPVQQLCSPTFGSCLGSAAPCPALLMYLET